MLRDLEDTCGDSERNQIIILDVAKDIKEETTSPWCHNKTLIESSEMSSKYCSMYLHKINVNSYHILQLYIVSIFVVYGL